MFRLSRGLKRVVLLASRIASLPHGVETHARRRGGGIGGARVLEFNYTWIPLQA